MICDVALYGHMTFDTIFDGDKKTTSIGSIGNVWRAFRYLNPYISVAVEPTEFGEALILIDRTNNKRTSKASLSEVDRIPNIHESKWSHILYINELKNTEILQQAKGIISADVCKGKRLNYNLLQHIDWLFTSEEEDNNNNLVAMVNMGVIVHTPTSATIRTKENTFTAPVEKTLNKVNVLGAGDFFAASVIQSILLKDSTDYNTILKQAHKDVYRMIENEI